MVPASFSVHQDARDALQTEAPPLGIFLTPQLLPQTSVAPPPLPPFLVGPAGLPLKHPTSPPFSTLPQISTTTASEASRSQDTMRLDVNPQNMPSDGDIVTLGFLRRLCLGIFDVIQRPSLTLTEVHSHIIALNLPIPIPRDRIECALKSRNGTNRHVFVFEEGRDEYSPRQEDLREIQSRTIGQIVHAELIRPMWVSIIAKTIRKEKRGALTRREILKCLERDGCVLDVAKGLDKGILDGLDRGVLVIVRGSNRESGNGSSSKRPHQSSVLQKQTSSPKPLQQMTQISKVPTPRKISLMPESGRPKAKSKVLRKKKEKRQAEEWTKEQDKLLTTSLDRLGWNQRSYREIATFFTPHRTVKSIKDRANFLSEQYNESESSTTPTDSSTTSASDHEDEEEEEYEDGDDDVTKPKKNRRRSTPTAVAQPKKRKRASPATTISTTTTTTTTVVFGHHSKQPIGKKKGMAGVENRQKDSDSAGKGGRGFSSGAGVTKKADERHGNSQRSATQSDDSSSNSDSAKRGGQSALATFPKHQRKQRAAVGVSRKKKHARSIVRTTTVGFHENDGETFFDPIDPLDTSTVNRRPHVDDQILSQTALPQAQSTERDNDSTTLAQLDSLLFGEHFGQKQQEGKTDCGGLELLGDLLLGFEGADESLKRTDSERVEMEIVGPTVEEGRPHEGGDSIFMGMLEDSDEEEEGQVDEKQEGSPPHVRPSEPTQCTPRKAAALDAIFSLHNQQQREDEVPSQPSTENFGDQTFEDFFNANIDMNCTSGFDEEVFKDIFGITHLELDLGSSDGSGSRNSSIVGSPEDSQKQQGHTSSPPNGLTATSITQSPHSQPIANNDPSLQLKLDSLFIDSTQQIPETEPTFLSERIARENESGLPATTPTANRPLDANFGFAIPATTTCLSQWTAEEDDLIARGVAKYGSTLGDGAWAEISKRLIPERTPRAIRERHERLLLARADEEKRKATTLSNHTDSHHSPANHDLEFSTATISPQKKRKFESSLVGGQTLTTKSQLSEDHSVTDANRQAAKGHSSDFHKPWTPTQQHADPPPRRCPRIWGPSPHPPPALSHRPQSDAPPRRHPRIWGPSPYPPPSPPHRPQSIRRSTDQPSVTHSNFTPVNKFDQSPSDFDLELSDNTELDDHLFFSPPNAGMLVGEKSPRVEILQGRVHFGYRCDLCDQDPILGQRYACRDCADGEEPYDLCGACYETRRGEHTAGHTFVEMQAAVDQGPPPQLLQIAESSITHHQQHLGGLSTETPARWTPEEDQLLLEGIKKHGRSWTEITRSLFPQRSAEAVRRRASKLRERASTATKQPNAERPWTSDEDRGLLAVVKKFGHSVSVWSALSQMVFRDRSVVSIGIRAELLLSEHMQARPDVTTPNHQPTTSTTVSSPNPSQTDNSTPPAVAPTATQPVLAPPPPESISNSPVALKDDSDEPAVGKVDDDLSTPKDVDGPPPPPQLLGHDQTTKQNETNELVEGSNSHQQQPITDDKKRKIVDAESATNKKRKSSPPPPPRTVIPTAVSSSTETSPTAAATATPTATPDHSTGTPVENFFWTPEEDQLVLQGRDMRNRGCNWAEISQALLPHRSPRAVQRRSTKLLTQTNPSPPPPPPPQPRPQLQPNLSTLNAQEQQALITLFAQSGAPSNKPWTPEEDRGLLAVVNKFGYGASVWSWLSQTVFRDRSAYAIANRAVVLQLPGVSTTTPSPNTPTDSQTANSTPPAVDPTATTTAQPGLTSPQSLLLPENIPNLPAPVAPKDDDSENGKTVDLATPKIERSPPQVGLEPQVVQTAAPITSQATHNGDPQKKIPDSPGPGQAPCSKRRWMSEEKRRLKEGVQAFGADSKACNIMSQTILPGRTASAIASHIAYMRKAGLLPSEGEVKDKETDQNRTEKTSKDQSLPDTLEIYETPERQQTPQTSAAPQSPSAQNQPVQTHASCSQWNPHDAPKDVDSDQGKTVDLATPKVGPPPPEDGLPTATPTTPQPIETQSLQKHRGPSKWWTSKENRLLMEGIRSLGAGPRACDTMSQTILPGRTAAAIASHIAHMRNMGFIKDESDQKTSEDEPFLEPSKTPKRQTAAPITPQKSAAPQSPSVQNEGSANQPVQTHASANGGFGSQNFMFNNMPFAWNPYAMSAFLLGQMTFPFLPFTPMLQPPNQSPPTSTPTLGSRPFMPDPNRLPAPLAPPPTAPQNVAESESAQKPSSPTLEDITPTIQDAPSVVEGERAEDKQEGTTSEEHQKQALSEQEQVRSDCELMPPPPPRAPPVVRPPLTMDQLETQITKIQTDIRRLQLSQTKTTYRPILEKIKCELNRLTAKLDDLMKQAEVGIVIEEGEISDSAPPS